MKTYEDKTTSQKLKPKKVGSLPIAGKTVSGVWFSIVGTDNEAFYTDAEIVEKLREVVEK